uniref:IDS1 protein n=1 Tax=Lolium multiflorum TaxID=4521 RepID=A5JQJ1_LOLMU|nr:IDS1 protein [Lolium multiflorum]
MAKKKASCYLRTCTLTPSHKCVVSQRVKLSSCRGCTRSWRRSCSPRQTRRRPSRTARPCSQKPRRGRPRPGSGW